MKNVLEKTNSQFGPIRLSSSVTKLTVNYRTLKKEIIILT